jgi:hypothetical protein
LVRNVTFDVMFTVRTACEDETSEILCQDEVSAGEDEAAVVGVDAGSDYFIIVEAYDETQSGYYSMDLTLQP